MLTCVRIYRPTIRTFLTTALPLNEIFGLVFFFFDNCLATQRNVWTCTFFDNCLATQRNVWTCIFFDNCLATQRNFWTCTFFWQLPCHSTKFLDLYFFLTTALLLNEMFGLVLFFWQVPCHSTKYLDLCSTLSHRYFNRLPASICPVFLHTLCQLSNRRLPCHSTKYLDLCSTFSHRYFNRLPASICPVFLHTLCQLSNRRTSTLLFLIQVTLVLWLEHWLKRNLSSKKSPYLGSQHLARNWP